MKEELFNLIEKILKNVKIDGFNVYDLCEENEKLKLYDDYSSSDVFAYKILKNSILLKFYDKNNKYVEIKYINKDLLNQIRNIFPNVSYKEGDLYIKIFIDDYKDVLNLEKEIESIFIQLFSLYMNAEESFGCCSRYIECSDKKQCVNNNIRLRFSCQYKKNLETGRIFYGKNKNISGEKYIDSENTIYDVINSSKREQKGKSLIDFPKDYCVIDIETTGLDPKYDEIIEVSALKIRDNKVIEKYTSLVKPEQRIIVYGEEIDSFIEEGRRVKYIDDFIAELTGITNQMLHDAPSIDEVLTSFNKFIGNDILIGHNINFDINFLYDNCINNMKEPLINNFIDTLRLSRKVLPELKHHRLDDLIKYFHKETRNQHRALNDCSLTNEIYKELESLIKEKYGSLDAFKEQCKKYSSTKSLRAKDIIAQTTEFNEEHPLFGKVCVFTGTLEKMQRKDAMQIVVNLGGICGDKVTSRTNFLILGNNDYCKTIKDGKSNKQKMAERLKIEGNDIEIISENVFYDYIFNE